MQRRHALLALAALPFAAVAGTTAAADLEINAATQAQLESLPGIGPALAQRILDARAESPFESWADLRRRVHGIGAKLARKLSDLGLRVRGEPFVSGPGH